SSEELFLQADKFEHDDQNTTQDSSSAVTYLCIFDQSGKDFHKKNLTILEQKAIYRKLHSIYKKALNKALQDNLKSQQLTNLLQEFVKNISEQSDSGESLQADDTNDKNFITPQLKNSKKYHEKR
ncbi:141_t:CDS:1, partial [Scutellospora calospora]